MHVSLARLLCHDWVKLTPAEFMPYARRFDKRTSSLPEGEKREIERAWRAAYRHHYLSMDHHHQFHVRGHREDMTAREMHARARPMPPQAAVEVCVDWLAAQWSYSGSWPVADRWTPLKRLSTSPDFHRATRALLCAVWSALGFPAPLLALRCARDGTDTTVDLNSAPPEPGTTSARNSVAATATAPSAAADVSDSKAGAVSRDGDDKGGLLSGWDAAVALAASDPASMRWVHSLRRKSSAG